MNVSTEISFSKFIDENKDKTVKEVEDKLRELIEEAEEVSWFNGQLSERDSQW